ncbi:MAG: type VI secretion system tip protein VgrG [Acidobacteriaceae bacterium]|nr:type VI secretion system tip protein VgrG [Acidobacteriaceae bacterium]
MGAFKQDDRLLTFTSPLGKDVLLPENLAGTEGVSELFFYRLDALATTDTTIDSKKIVGQKVCVALQASDTGARRYINGFVSGFEMNGGDEEFNNYRVYIVPNLWALTLNRNTRVFQDMTVIDVIKQVLSTYKISPADETSNTYTKMEYCTQYRETDFAFISRLMEQHGILYYFKHSEDDHTFTLQDVSSKLNACPIQNKLRYAPQGDITEGFYDFVVTEFHSRTSMVSGIYSDWDFGFVPYNVSTDKQTTRGPLGQNNNEYYDYANSAAAYLKKNDSQSKIPDLVKFFNTVRYQSGDAASVFVKGDSNAICLQTGYNFELSKHPQASLNEKYLVLHAEHNVRQMPSYRSKNQNTGEPYGNTFTAIPFSIPYRPPFKTPRPVVNGMHTGRVVVSSGEDSHMDKYGRVNVQVWWDRQRKANTPDNTWLRVAQSWAGKGWGTYFWPRIDDEVLIDFIEGDPDQPIVVGSVYNGVNMPKYDPAGQYTLSGILTRSSKDGGADNANELRFEDLKGKEQIFMNAERDYDLHVENSRHTLVGQEQHEQIGADHYVQTSGDTHLHIKKKLYEQVDDEVHQTLQSKQVIKVGADRHENIGSNSVIKIGSDSNIDVGQNLNEKVGMDYSLNVGMNQYDKVGMVYVVDAGMEAHIKGGMTVVIEGGMGVCLSGPGGFVSIDPSGVTIQGMMVRINSGGASLEGSPAQTQNPLSPDSPTTPKDPKFPGDKPPSQASEQGS